MQLIAHQKPFGLEEDKLDDANKMLEPSTKFPTLHCFCKYVPKGSPHVGQAIFWKKINN